MPCSRTQHTDAAAFQPMIFISRKQHLTDMTNMLLSHNNKIIIINVIMDKYNKYHTNTNQQNHCLKTDRSLTTYLSSTSTAKLSLSIFTATFYRQCEYKGQISNVSRQTSLTIYRQNKHNTYRHQ